MVFERKLPYYIPTTLISSPSSRSSFLKSFRLWVFLCLSFSLVNCSFATNSTNKTLSPDGITLCKIPIYPCENFCCSSPDYCSTSSTNPCCFHDWTVSFGICCPPNTKNCGGTCCGGECMRIPIHPGVIAVCVYHTDAQCETVDGVTPCTSEGGCPNNAPVCNKNGCCYTEE
jgi:hypothetical protein